MSADRRQSAIISPAEKILGAETPLKDQRKKYSIFSLFSSSPSRKITSARSDMSLSSPEISPTHASFLKATGRTGSGSSTYGHQSPSTDGPSRRTGFSSTRKTPPNWTPTTPISISSPASHHQSISLSPTASSPFPSIDTKTRVSPTTRPSQKFLLQMPLSLALRTATITTQLPVIQAATSQADNPTGKKYKFLFGATYKPTASPNDYELGGRSTFALVHGAILRYHSAFGDDPDVNATPTSTHFLNGSSIVFVTDAVQGFKWVLEIKTWSKGHNMRSPIKRAKSSKDTRDRNVDLTQAPWAVVDGVQAWYMIFETPNLMTEWMTLLRVAIADLKSRDTKSEKGALKTPKSVKSPSKEKEPKYVRSSEASSPATSSSESLPSSPSSSRISFIGRSIDGFLSKRNSVVDTALDEHSATTAFGRSLQHIAVGESPPPPRRRQPSQQDIALTAFRISALEEDLAAFVPPAVEPPPPEVRVTSNSMKSESDHSHHCGLGSLSPNLSHYSHKRASVISLQSRLSSVSSGLRTPNLTAVSPTSSPAPKGGRRRLRRTYSGDSQKTTNSWKQHQNAPPPHPPPTGPLPEPPSQPIYIHTSYQADLFSRRPQSDVFDHRESLVLGVSPVFETETPKMISHITPRASPIVPARTMGAVISSQPVKIIS
jgi:hypothetical protein